MKYTNIVEGTFVSRPNRFVANVIINGEIVKCHVKNTGRCKELLLEGAKVFLKDYDNDMRNRKLRYSLIGVVKNKEEGSSFVNIDSHAPNIVVREALEKGTILIEGYNKDRMKISMEKTFNNSRFDILIEEGEKKAFIEVKGVTLENDGIAMFPDAPTIRGVKHINELVSAFEEGYGAYIIFVLQMSGMKVFRPNDKMHMEFGEALRKSSVKGVIPLAYECIVMENQLHISRMVEIDLYNI